MESGRWRSSRDLQWVSQSREDFKAFPDEVQDEAGYELWLVQTGKRPLSAKVLKGFGGAGLLELVERYDGDTYRVVYTVRFRHAIYVLHAFQKKSKQGAKTPRKELDLIRSRFEQATRDHEQRYSHET
jgi:phage-related protein